MANLNNSGNGSGDTSDFAFDALCARYSDLYDAAGDTGRDIAFWDAARMAGEAAALGRTQDFLDYQGWYSNEGAYLPTPDETPLTGEPRVIAQRAFHRALARIHEMEGR